MDKFIFNEYLEMFPNRIFRDIYIYSFPFRFLLHTSLQILLALRTDECMPQNEVVMMLLLLIPHFQSSKVMQRCSTDKLYYIECYQH